MKLGVVTTSYPRTAGDPAGSFVAAHVEALRALGHDVEVIAVGTPPASRSGASRSGASKSSASLSGATLTGASRSGAALSGGSLSGASSSGGSSSGAALSGGSLSGAALSGGSLSGGSLSGGSSSGASLSGASLSGAPLSGAPVRWIASSLFDHGGAPDRLERHPVRSLAAAALVSARLTLAVARRAATWDSIIAHWLVPSAIAALPARVPLLAIAHGGDIHTLRRTKLLAPVLRALSRRDAQLAFVSEPLREIARAAAPDLGAWLDSATIQPMGLDLARFRRVGHTPTRPPTIVIAARLVDIKGVDVAIDALAHLRAPVRLVIAGDGPERSQLEARARERCASGASDTHAAGRLARAGHACHSIEFLGTVDTVRRDRLLRDASIVVVPSRVTASGRTEGMPMIALEALAAGIPVVASDVGGLSGLGAAARLVRPDQPRELAAAIDQTLSEPPDAERLRSAVAHLGWENVAPRLVRST